MNLTLKLSLLSFVYIKYVIPGALKVVGNLAVVGVELLHEFFVERERSRLNSLARVAKVAAHVGAKVSFFHVVVDLRLDVLLHPFAKG